MDSSFEFYDILVHKGGKVDYLWICIICGKVQPNVAEDSPPDYCEGCDNNGE